MGVVICKIVLGVLVCFTGTCVFSFLNVIIYRVPRKLSFVKGFSICPSCGQRLGAADLIPIFSYVFLRGRCRYCKALIGVRDTLVEGLGGAAALLCVFKYGYSVTALTVFAFLSVLTVVAFLDIDTMEIEDGCWIAVVILSMVSVFTMPGLHIWERLIGAVCVSVPMLVLTIVIPGAFGGGDIKLMAACGLFLGWKLTLVSMALAILIGGLYGCYVLAAKKLERKDHFAFGPFLCMGMVLGLFTGAWVIDWYLGFLLY